jgi:transketolase
MHTVKPLDNDLVLQYAEKTNAIVTCENHQIAGGLGGAVAELLAEQRPTFMERIGSRDKFGQVGLIDYLIKNYGMTAESIVEKAYAVIKKRG